MSGTRKPVKSSRSWPPRRGRQRSKDDILRMGREVVLCRRAVERDLRDRPLADVMANGKVRKNDRDDEDCREHTAGGKRSDRRLDVRGALANQQRRGDGHHERREEDPVIERRQRLESEEQAGQQPVTQAPGTHCAVQCPQAQRHPLRHLQLEVRVVHVAIRQEREDEAGDERRARVAGQRAHEQEHRRAGERK